MVGSWLCGMRPDATSRREDGGRVSERLGVCLTSNGRANLQGRAQHPAWPCCRSPFVERLEAQLLVYENA